MAKIQNISRDVNGISVDQRVADGFINATAMCAAHGKDINDWFTPKDVFELFVAFADDLEIEIKTGDFRDLDVARLSGSKYAKIFPGLVLSRRGSPETGGGTWLHYDLAIQLAQWCNKPFAIQVSRWVREWMTTGQNPIWKQGDIDRVIYRDTLKDESRIRMTNQIKIYLEQIQRYDDKKFSGIFFARVHDAINIAIVGETAKQMRIRLGQLLGREVKDSELIRDYYPALDLQRYIAVCEAVANLMIREELQPLIAVESATQIVLPANHQAKPIDFSENVKFVRQRLSQPVLGQENPKFLL